MAAYSGSKASSVEGSAAVHGYRRGFPSALLVMKRRMGLWVRLRISRPIFDACLEVVAAGLQDKSCTLS